VVHGSLGGLQVLDLSPEGQMQPRILSFGKDPLIQRNIGVESCIDVELHCTCRQPVLSTEENQAFRFTVRRPLEEAESGEYLVHLSKWS
jgi:vacuolar protein sorting-associated protein 13D